MALALMYITNDPAVARIADQYGVDRVWIDLETLGKEERQKNMNTVKSHHSVSDIAVVSKVLSRAELMVRINPWNAASEQEIEDVIKAGAQRIMLPMWKSAAEVDAFLRSVNGRVATTLLLETKEAVECLDEVLKHPQLDEIHVGLNDLHLSYGLTFMFELLTNGVVESLCQKFKKAGIAYGFGGIAGIGEGLLPAEKIMMEHYRLGSTRVILSRSFCNAAEIKELTQIEATFARNMKALRDFEKRMPLVGTEDYENNIASVRECVNMIVQRIKEKN